MKTVEMIEVFPVLAILVSTEAAAQNDVTWTVRLFANNPDYIEVIVDASQIEKNAYLDNVTFGVSFSNSKGQPMGTAKWPFTDSRLRVVERERYRRYFMHNHPGARSAQGVLLEFDKVTKGGKADGVDKGPSRIHGKGRSNNQMDVSSATLIDASPPNVVEKVNGKDAPSPVKLSRYENGVDRGGADYKQVSGTLEECAKVCLADEQCLAFSYRLSSKQCWLKSSAPSPRADPDFVSAVKHRG